MLLKGHGVLGMYILYGKSVILIRQIYVEIFEKYPRHTNRVPDSINNLELYDCNRVGTVFKSFAYYLKICRANGLVEMIYS